MSGLSIVNDGMGQNESREGSRSPRNSEGPSMNRSIAHSFILNPMAEFNEESGHPFAKPKQPDEQRPLEHEIASMHYIGIESPGSMAKPVTIREIMEHNEKQLKLIEEQNKVGKSDPSE